MRVYKLYLLVLTHLLRFAILLCDTVGSNAPGELASKQDQLSPAAAQQGSRQGTQGVLKAGYAGDEPVAGLGPPPRVYVISASAPTMHRSQARSAAPSNPYSMQACTMLPSSHLIIFNRYFNPKRLYRLLRGLHSMR